MSQGTPEISVVIPVHNEAEALEGNIRRIHDFVGRLGLPFELVAVDDCSSDGSWDVLRRLAESGLSLRVIHHATNLGKGSALRSGLGASEGSWAVLVDADLELPIEMLTSFIDIQHRTSADLVVGSKRHPQSRVVYPLSRRILSRAYNLGVRTFFDLPVSDTQVGFKLIRGPLARQLSRSAVVKRFAIDVELLVQARLLDAQMADAPVMLQYSRAGLGRITLRTVVEIARETAGVWYRRYITGFYSRALESPGRARGSSRFA